MDIFAWSKFPSSILPCYQINCWNTLNVIWPLINFLCMVNIIKWTLTRYGGWPLMQLLGFSNYANIRAHESFYFFILKSLGGKVIPLSAKCCQYRQACWHRKCKNRYEICSKTKEKVGEGKIQGKNGMIHFPEKILGGSSIHWMPNSLFCTLMRNAWKWGGSQSDSPTKLRLGGKMTAPAMWRIRKMCCFT